MLWYGTIFCIWYLDALCMPEALAASCMVDDWNNKNRKLGRGGQIVRGEKYRNWQMQAVRLKLRIMVIETVRNSMDARMTHLIMETVRDWKKANRWV